MGQLRMEDLLHTHKQIGVEVLTTGKSLLMNTSL